MSKRNLSCYYRFESAWSRCITLLGNRPRNSVDYFLEVTPVICCLLVRPTVTCVRWWCRIQLLCTLYWLIVYFILYLISSCELWNFIRKCLCVVCVLLIVLNGHYSVRCNCSVNFMSSLFILQSNSLNLFFSWPAPLIAGHKVQFIYCTGIIFAWYFALLTVCIKVYFISWSSWNLILINIQSA